MVIEVRRFKFRLNTSRAERFPFDIVYLFKEKDREFIPKYFSTCLVIKPSLDLRIQIVNIPLDKVSHRGLNRQQHREESYYPPSNMIGDALVHEDDLMVIPVLTTNVGGKRKLRYLVNKRAMAGLSHTNKYEIPVQVAIAGKELMALQLQHQGKLISPCTVCVRGMKKFLNPDSCTLGSKLCLESITLGTKEKSA